jgi:hypothetical protein
MLPPEQGDQCAFRIGSSVAADFLPCNNFGWWIADDEAAAPRTSAYQSRTARPSHRGDSGGDQTHRKAAYKTREAMWPLRRVLVGNGRARAGSAEVHLQGLRQAGETGLARHSALNPNGSRALFLNRDAGPLDHVRPFGDLGFDERLDVGERHIHRHARVGSDTGFHRRIGERFLYLGI